MCLRPAKAVVAGCCTRIASSVQHRVAAAPPWSLLSCARIPACKAWHIKCLNRFADVPPGEFNVATRRLAIKYIV